jgi:hypothetical protein
MKSEPPTWKVQEVLDRIPELGIPHFQRGMVWGDDLKGALLESLYYDTPCGSLVLWQPDDPAALGVPIDESSAVTMRLLVIDGQQRIRSLRSIFEGDGGDRIWCINLAALQEFSRASNIEKRQRPLFVLIQDPSLLDATKPVPPVARNVLPIRLVENCSAISDPAFDVYRVRKLLNVDEKLLGKAYPDLHSRIVKLRDRQFFVSVQKGSSLRDMVGLYNRINSAGRRVEPEERAFARLVGLQENTYENLRGTFEQIHPNRRTAAADGQKNKVRLARDDVMKREREQAFGFKLFIRVFMQVAQYHLAYPKGRTEFSFEIADRPPFITAFGGLEKPEADRLWTEAQKVLNYVAGILRSDLNCDDFRFVPDANSLQPVLQLLIHFSGLREDRRYRGLIALLVQSLLLAELDAKTILRLIQLAGDPHRTSAAPVIRDMLAILRHERLSDAQIEKRLKEARTLQHRYVLLLYGVQRSRGSRDLLYENLPAADLKKFKRQPGNEVAIDLDAAAQKQHMIPFSLAQRLYPDATRAGSHAVNSIGNLTFISGDLNSCFGGLGDVIVDLDREPPQNRWAHVLQAAPDDADDRFLEDYRQLRTGFDGAKDTTSTSALRAMFERMTARRRVLLFAAVKKWMEQLETSACHGFKVGTLDEAFEVAEREARIEGESYWFPRCGSISPVHVLQALDYSSADEDRLAELLAHGTKAWPKKWEVGLPKYELRLAKQKKIWVKMKPPGVWLRFDPSVSAAMRRKVCQLLGLEPDERPNVPLAPVPCFIPLLDALPEIEKQLASAAKPS